MQKEVVLQATGPLLVLAGAGSGKTSALTTRIAYQIKHLGVEPGRILAVTFTNKAANEMKERVLRLLGENSATFAPNIGTFHSICVRILRRQIHQLGYDRNFVIYDTADQQLLIKKILEDQLIDPKKINPKAVLNFISGAKNELVGPEEYNRFANNYFTEKVALCYRHYQRQLQQSNALDFDDIIMKTVQLFQDFPDILAYYQDLFQYISVDEYQDTNHAQYILTNLLAARHRNLCVIGDSDQSIYAFRGANIQNILNFEKDYPEAKVVFLEQNYRSTQIILDAAHHVIVKNTQRRDKKLWTEREGGDKITLKTLHNEREEGEFVVKTIRQSMENREAHDGPADYRNFVVLYRTNAQSRVLEEAFLRYAIPYKIIGGIKFYERKEIRDLVAYLRVVQNPHDSISLLRIINTPARKIGQKTIEAVQQYASTHDCSFWSALKEMDSIESLRDSKTKALEEFVNLISHLQAINQEFPASGVIKHALDLSGYKKMLDDGTAEGESRLQNVHELISVAGKYDGLPAGESLGIFLEEISLIADIDKLDESDNAVTLMTVHAAKGLEFPTVFLVGLEDGIFPHSRSLLERKELEEERRLMYVAITRAKHKLYLLHAENRLLYGESQSNAASQFLRDIPEEILHRDEPVGGRDISWESSRFFGGMASAAPRGIRPLPDESVDFSGDLPSIPAHSSGAATPTSANRTSTAHGLQSTTSASDSHSITDDLPLQQGDRVTHDKFGPGWVLAAQGGVVTVKFDSLHHGIKKLALSVAPLRRLG